jgi:CO/xanthine dehydrogenase Mo-binding subunit
MAASTEQYVGARIPRVEDHRYLTGRARFVDDVQLPGTLHAAFVRSPYAHARIVSCDAERARSLPGVVAVVTGQELAEFPAFSTGLPRPEVNANERRVLPLDRVRFVGEAVVAVAATSRYVAEDACALVEIDWEPLPAIVDAEASLAPGAPLLHDGAPSNSFAHVEYEHGDVDAA